MDDSQSMKKDEILEILQLDEIALIYQKVYIKSFFNVENRVGQKGKGYQRHWNGFQKMWSRQLNEYFFDLNIFQIVKEFELYNIS